MLLINYPKNYIIEYMALIMENVFYLK